MPLSEFITSPKNIALMSSLNKQWRSVLNSKRKDKQYIFVSKLESFLKDKQPSAKIAVMFVVGYKNYMIFKEEGPIKFGENGQMHTNKERFVNEIFQDVPKEKRNKLHWGVFWGDLKAGTKIQVDSGCYPFTVYRTYHGDCDEIADENLYSVSQECNIKSKRKKITRQELANLGPIEDPTNYEQFRRFFARFEELLESIRGLCS